MFGKFLAKYTTFDFMIIALLSACGIATKPFVRILAQIFTGSIIPVGTVAGIFYMLWIVLACTIVQKRGTAILVGIVQSVLVVVFDMLGNRGLANLLVYVVRGYFGLACCFSAMFLRFLAVLSPGVAMPPVR